MEREAAAECRAECSMVVQRHRVGRPVAPEDVAAERVAAAVGCMAELHRRVELHHRAELQQTATVTDPSSDSRSSGGMLPPFLWVAINGFAGAL
mgnify:CR=1 FL=1